MTAMRDQGLISEEAYLEAWHADIQLVGETEEEEDASDTGIYSWYTECVIDETVKLLMQEYGYTEDIARTKLYTGGLQIITAQNPKLQGILEEYYENDDNFEKVDESLIQPESSFVLLDPYNGDVLAVVGGRGEKTGNRLLNYATGTKRPSGSSIKPITVYAPAIEYGLVNYGTIVDDTPVNFGTETVDPETGDIIYSRPTGYPRNSNGRYNGLVTIHYALRRSINTVSYKTLMMVGLDRSFEFAKEKCHLENLIESQEMDGYSVTDKAYAPLALGQQSFGLTNLEMTAAYSIFANEGVYNHPRFVTEIYDSDWNLIIDNKKTSEIVISETTASLMTLMLEEVVDSGTASRLTIKNKIDVAAKTGTTQSECDRWLIGYTPYFLGGVWVGYSMPQPLDSFTVNPVITAWDGVMTAVHQHLFDEAAQSGEPLKEFRMADGIVQATYCADSGKLVTDACMADPRGSRVETGYFTTDTVPTEECDVHVLVKYDPTTKSIAHSGCPEEVLVEVGLLNIRRLFPCQVTITDAEYVFWDLLEFNIDPSGTVNEPFFILAVPEKMFAGISSGNSQYNHICTEHIYVPPVTDVPDSDESESDGPGGPDPDESGSESAGGESEPGPI